MYSEHQKLEKPEPRAILWRYMDLGKFYSLIERKALFFSAPRAFGDPFEGHFPKDFYDKMRTIEKIDVRENNMNFLRWSAQVNQHHHCVSCWHLAEHQSAAMWRLYSKDRSGIAITTTYEDFKRSLDTCDVAVLGGKVRYIDFHTYIPQSDEFNLFVALTWKRKSFEYEKEFRAIVYGPSIQDQTLKSANGFFVPVDINTLIKEIYIAPDAPANLKADIISLLKKYSLEKPVHQSDLNDGPDYIH